MKKRRSESTTMQESGDQRFDHFIEVCREQGIKATHQRMEILRELAETENHPDADTIYLRVRKRIPTISLDTVYRTLRMLEEKGVISRVGSIKERARFDANTQRHHHFVCMKCGLIRDFTSAALDRIRPPEEVADMGSVDSVYIEMRGLCAVCSRKSGAA